MYDLFTGEARRRVEEDGFHVFWDEALKSVTVVDKKDAIVITPFNYPEPVDMIVVMMCYGTREASPETRPIMDSEGNMVAYFDPKIGMIIEHDDRFYAVPLQDGIKFSVTRIAL